MGQSSGNAQRPGSRRVESIEATVPRDGARERAAPRLLFQQAKQWAGISVARYRFPPGERRVPAVPGHILRLHRSEPHYLIHRLDGRTQARTETRDLITVIPADRPFEQVFHSESDDYNVVLPDQIVRRAAESAGLDPDQVEILDRFCVGDPYVLQLGLALGAELESDSIGELLYAESLGYAMAVHLVRKYSSVSDRADRLAARSSAERLSTPVLERVMEYIEANLGGALTLADIAAATNLSPYHFARLFKATTGRPPHQYVIERRIDLARSLLLETELPIGEVALRSGFSDQSHLGRHLRRRFGVTPRMLRTRHRRRTFDDNSAQS